MAKQEGITTKDVLKVLGISAVVIGGMIVPSLPKAAAVVVKAWKDVNRKDLGRIITRLQKQEMISISGDMDKVTISITDKGKTRLLEYDFENISLTARKRDGKWRLIIFDIPEGLKRNRNIFARKLLQIGCLRLQDSVYVSAFPCKKEIDFLCHFLEISTYVTLVTLGKFERGEELFWKSYQPYDD